MADGQHTKTGFDDNFALELSRIACNSSNNKDFGPGMSFLQSELNFEASITSNSRWRPFWPKILIIRAITPHYT